MRIRRQMQINYQMNISRHGQRFWAVRDGNDRLVCVTVYKKGAQEVVRRLSSVLPGTWTAKPRRKRGSAFRKEKAHGSRHAHYDSHL